MLVLLMRGQSLNSWPGRQGTSTVDFPEQFAGLDGRAVACTLEIWAACALEIMVACTLDI